MKIDQTIQPANLTRKINRFWELSAEKIRSIERDYDSAKGSPVFTVRGRYTARGWTEWTQGFKIGSALLQFDATGEAEFLELGRTQTVNLMAPHVSHFGVHDHGFNNVSTYGNLLRLMAEGRIAENAWERAFYELALKVSGATQARRWTALEDGGGFIYSFNGPHSLFVDTIRSLRSLALAHQLGHVLMEENDRRVSLLDRLKAHAAATAKIFHLSTAMAAMPTMFADGPSTRASSTSTMAVFAVPVRSRVIRREAPGRAAWRGPCAGLPNNWSSCAHIGDKAVTPQLRQAAEATCDFYIRHATAADGIPYWDTGAPQLHRLGDWQSRPADPFNSHEPVDSSAAAIAAQGLLRLGRHLKNKRYWQAGLTVLNTLFDEPYLSTGPKHQGLLFCTAFIIVPMAGTTSRAATPCRAANPACGEITMRARPPSTSSASRRAGDT